MAYDPELDEVIWQGEPILFRDGKATLTVQIARYNGGMPRLYVRESGTFKGFQQDDQGKFLMKEPKQLREYGRPYIRRMELDIIHKLLPLISEGVEALVKYDEIYKKENK
jgi:hypothetical protein